MADSSCAIVKSRSEIKLQYCECGNLIGVGTLHKCSGFESRHSDQHEDSYERLGPDSSSEADAYPSDDAEIFSTLRIRQSLCVWYTAGTDA